MEDESETIGPRRRATYQAKDHPQPREREGKEHNQAECREPGEGAGRGAEAYEQGDPDDENDAHQRADQAADDLSGQH